MKIVICVSCLTKGGAERVAALWATGFVERGHEVSMILSSTLPEYISYPIPDAVKLYSIGSNLRFPLLRSLKNRIDGILGFQFLKMRRILKKIEPDVVIGVLHPWALQALKVTKGLNVKIINTEHNSFERPTSAPMPKWLVQSKFELNKLFDHVTVLTNADKKILNGTLSNVTVLPNPLTFPPVKGMPLKEKIILASGRLDAWECKGFDVLIKSFALICKDYPDWVLQLAGVGEEESLQWLTKLARNEGIPDSQISFLGFCNDMESLYQRTSIFVLSSRYEGFGMVLVEAMSQGCACIACDYKGRQREIITDSSQGIICPVEDSDSLARAMETLIVNKEYREECQINAIERSKFYSLNNTMDRWHDIFTKMNLS